MYISEKVKYVGVRDKKIDLFEGQFSVKDGMTYNSYVILSEKIAVMDSVERDFAHEWLDKIKDATGDRSPDYLVVSHMEPDHSGSILDFLKAYPDAKIVASSKAFSMMKSFFGNDFADKRVLVSDGSTLSLGDRSLRFISAPMVHWPEVMMAYDESDKILFSADAFGTFGMPNDKAEWLYEARRYYYSIVSKYGAQVNNLLDKLQALEIEKISSLHGPVISENIPYYTSLYRGFASYTPESDGILIAYSSVYGNTARAVEMLSEKLRAGGCPEVVVIDLQRTDKSHAVAEAFRLGNLVLASTTYNGDVFPAMREFIYSIRERGFTKRRVGFIENGSWAPMSAKLMRSMLDECKDISYYQSKVSILSSLSEESTAQLNRLAEEILREYREKGTMPIENDPTALFSIGYGLYVVTSNDGKRDNGLIVNTVTQVTNTPNRIAVTINKSNYSHHVIKNTGIMNVNCLSTDAPFAVFERFGFVSGRNVDKFKDMTPSRSENGLAYLTKYINAYMSLKVESYVDLGTHGMFICSITESKKLSDKESMSYAYYHKNVKPKPKAQAKGYVCTVCGFVYDEDTLPEDYVCPLCGHPATDFEKL